MQSDTISATLAATFPLHKRLQQGIDRWQQLMPAQLLRAALLETTTAVRNVKSIQNQLDVHDPIQRQVLPQLHANIANHLPTDIAATLKKARIETLVRSQARLSELPSLASCLGQAGIPLLALKGAALAPTYYQDIGCRPFDDLDLLVPEDDVHEAIKALTAQGWQAAVVPQAHSHYVDSRFYHAYLFSHPDKLVEVDLHVHCHLGALWAGVDKPYWQRAVPLDYCEGVLRLSDTDNLMQVCNHGIAQNFDSPVRWAMDAYQIIKNGKDNIDWDWVVHNVNVTCIAPQLLATFIWLQQELKVDIPPQVINGLGNAEYNHHGLKFWDYRLEPESSIYELANKHWHKFSLYTKNLSASSTMGSILGYLKSRANQESYLAVASAMLMKTGDRLTRRFRNNG
jgi:hypothetical protein